MMELAKYTPFARYFLVAAGTWLVKSGYIDSQTADEAAKDPFLIEIVAGVILWVITIAWYAFSKAKKALDDATAPKAT
jgi:hypothetical protein